jgi:PHD/YefM family antitoxin component YafN of YafNO toxin-antitoxin module
LLDKVYGQTLQTVRIVYATVHAEKIMETIKVGIREFRDNLATYLLEANSPVAITRHGDTVGYFIPARRKRSETDRAALKEAALRWQAVLAAEGITEDDAVQGFKRWRSGKK